MDSSDDPSRRPPRWLWVPLLAFVVTRLGIALIAYLAEPLIADNPAIAAYHVRPDNVLLDSFGSRWDTGFYLSIATEGYRFEGVELPSVAFFPLLPLLIRALMALGIDPLVGGLLVANGALLAASVLLFRLAALEGDERTATRAAWYLLLFPTSLFGSAIYSESLFLALAIGALYAARRDRWGVATLLGILATSSRLVGIIIAPLLLAEWWLRRRSAQRAGALAGLLAPLGTVAYMAFLGWRFGEPLAFAKASQAWAREPQPLWETIGELLVRPAEGWGSALAAGRLPLDNWLDLLFPLGILALGLWLLLRERRVGEGLFVLLGTLIPLNSGLLMSQRRYVWVLFPVFLLLARWGAREGVDRTITTLFALLLALFTALFANWYWVG